MLLNLTLHIGMGLLGNKIFTWTGTGIFWCLVLSSVIQGIDMFRIYRITIKRIYQQPPHIQEEQKAAFKQRLPFTFPQFYIVKVIGYGLITMVLASVTRAMIQ